MSKFVLVDVGCIECGEGTEAIGVYRTKKVADEAFRAYIAEKGADQWGYYFDGGQHNIEILEVEQ